jgi:hypothetical protein
MVLLKVDILMQYDVCVTSLCLSLSLVRDQVLVVFSDVGCSVPYHVVRNALSFVTDFKEGERLLGSS